jgi:hypothetical protein
MAEAAYADLETPGEVLNERGYGPEHPTLAPPHLRLEREHRYADPGAVSTRRPPAHVEIVHAGSISISEPSGLSNTSML